MARQPLTHDELRVASKHLAHSWIVFVSALRRGAELPSDLRQEVVLRAMLNTATAVHLRNLLDFFDPGGKERDTDLIAMDFIPNWDAIKPPRPPQFQDVLRYAGKLVMHLTHERTSHADHLPILGFHEFLALLAPYHEAFICNVDPDKLDNDWRNNMTVFGVVASDAGPVLTVGSAVHQDVAIRLGLRHVDPQRTGTPQFWGVFGPTARR